MSALLNGPHLRTRGYYGDFCRVYSNCATGTVSLLIFIECMSVWWLRWWRHTLLATMFSAFIIFPVCMQAGCLWFAVLDWCTASWLTRGCSISAIVSGRTTTDRALPVCVLSWVLLCLRCHWWPVLGEEFCQSFSFRATVCILSDICRVCVCVMYHICWQFFSRWGFLPIHLVFQLRLQSV